MRRWTTSVRALLALVALGAVACAPKDPGQRDAEIVIGMVAPLTGPQFVAGQPTVEGATLALEEINSRGGVRVGPATHRLRLVVENSGGVPEVAIGKTFKLISKDRVTALLGFPVSQDAMAVSQVAEQHKIPMVVTVATHPEVTRGRRYVFRIAFTNVQQAQAIAHFSYAELGARRAALLVTAGNAYSQSFCDIFAAEFQNLGGAVVEPELFVFDRESHEAQFESIRQAEADVLAMPVPSMHLESLIKEAREAGVTATFVGGDTWAQAVFAADAGRGRAFFADLWTPENEDDLSRRFVQRYRERFDTTPVTAAAVAYDGFGLLVDAIERSDSTAPDVLRAALQSTQSFRGVTGHIRYEETGDPVRDVLIIKVDETGQSLPFVPDP